MGAIEQEMSVKKERLGYSVEQSGPDKHEKLLWFCRGFYSVIQKIPLISRALKPDVNNNQESDKAEKKEGLFLVSNLLPRESKKKLGAVR